MGKAKNLRDVLAVGAGGVVAMARVSLGLIGGTVLRVADLARSTAEPDLESRMKVLRVPAPEENEALKRLVDQLVGPTDAQDLAARPTTVRSIDSSKQVPLLRLSELDLESPLSVSREDFGVVILSATRALRGSFQVDALHLTKVDGLLKQLTKTDIPTTVPFERQGNVNTRDLRATFAVFASAFHDALEQGNVGKKLDSNLDVYANQLVAAAEGRGASVKSVVLPPAAGLTPS